MPMLLLTTDRGLCPVLCAQLFGDERSQPFFTLTRKGEPATQTARNAALLLSAHLEGVHAVVASVNSNLTTCRCHFTLSIRIAKNANDRTNANGREGNEDDTDADDDDADAAPRSRVSISLMPNCFSFDQYQETYQRIMNEQISYLLEPFRDVAIAMSRPRIEVISFASSVVLYTASAGKVAFCGEMGCSSESVCGGVAMVHHFAEHELVCTRVPHLSHVMAFSHQESLAPFERQLARGKLRSRNDNMDDQPTMDSCIQVERPKGTRRSANLPTTMGHLGLVTALRSGGWNVDQRSLLESVADAAIRPIVGILVAHRRSFSDKVYNRSIELLQMYNLVDANAIVRDDVSRATLQNVPTLKGLGSVGRSHSSCVLGGQRSLARTALEAEVKEFLERGGTVCAPALCFDWHIMIPCAPCSSLMLDDASA